MGRVNAERLVCSSGYPSFTSPFPQHEVTGRARFMCGDGDEVEVQGSSPMHKRTTPGFVLKQDSEDLLSDH